MQKDVRGAKRSRAGSIIKRVVFKKANFVRRSTAYSNYPQVKGDIKTVDVTGSIGVYQQALTICLNAIGAGTDSFQRIGKRVQPYSVTVRCGLVPSGGSTTSLAYDSMRFMLVWDKQPNGVLTQVGSIIQDIDGAGTLTTNSLSDVNIANVDRFVILRDKRLSMLHTNTASGLVTVDYENPQENLQWTWKVNLKGCIQQFSSAGASISTISTGALLIFALGENSSTLTNYPLTMNYKSRFSYKDY